MCNSRKTSDTVDIATAVSTLKVAKVPKKGGGRRRREGGGETV
jgi:hypothetical protein